jgi:drug/metabolite transporter (DMT)-like permease
MAPSPGIVLREVTPIARLGQGPSCPRGAAAQHSPAPASGGAGIDTLSLHLRPAAVPLLPQTADNLPGIGMTVLGVFLFSFCNALAKHLVTIYPVGEMLFVRSATALVLLAAFIGPRDIAAIRAGGKPWLHALRMACSGLEVGCYYWALASMQLAGITTIYMAAPIYTVGLSALFLREQVGWRRWAAVVIGFTGVVVALHPGAGAVSVPALVAVVGSLLYAVSLVATRRLRGTPNSLLVASQVAALLVFSGASSALGWVMPTPLEAGEMALIGAISLIAYLCVNRGLQLAPASVVAPFQYSSIVWAVALGFAVFAEVPRDTTVLGAAIIAGAGLFILFRERVRG